MAIAVAFLALLLLAIAPDSSESSTIRVRRQYLPERPGYIPVYIQLGDEPPKDPLEYERFIQESALSRSNTVSLNEEEENIKEVTASEPNQKPIEENNEQILDKNKNSREEENI